MAIRHPKECLGHHCHLLLHQVVHYYRQMVFWEVGYHYRLVVVVVGHWAVLDLVKAYALACQEVVVWATCLHR